MCWELKKEVRKRVKRNLRKSVQIKTLKNVPQKRKCTEQDQLLQQL